MLKDYSSLAIKNLKHRGIRSWLTLLGIFIGITAVVSLISLGNALQTAVVSQFGIGSMEVITVQAGGSGTNGPPGAGAVVPLTTSDVDAIKKLNSVKMAVGRKISSGKLEYNNHVVFGFAVDVPNGEDRKFIYDQSKAKAVAGRLLKDGDTGKVVLGYNFYADKVGLGKEVVPGKSVLIQDKKFQVIGIMEKKGSFIFDNIVLMNSKDSKDLFNYGDVVDTIEVQPKDKNQIDKTKEDIEKLLRQRRNVKIGEEDFKVSTPQASLNTVKGILGGVQAFIVIIALISIFIGAIGIINTMTTSVLERRKEIGIMKAIGARNKDIFLQFFFESSFLGLIGGIIGIIVGTLIGALGTFGINSWLGTNIGMSFNFFLIFGALLGSFLIGGLAGIFPAMNAAKQNPVEALRG